MSIPKCPFVLNGDVVCAELIPDQILIARPQTASDEGVPGRFQVIGVGPGIPYDQSKPDSPLRPMKHKVGDWILFQKQNAFMFQDSGRLPERYFAMLRDGQILCTWDDQTPPQETVNKILGMH